MTYNELLKKLDISKLSIIWAYLTGGVAGLVKLFCDAITKLLKKADPQDLKNYSELAIKVADLIKFIVDTFVTDEKIKAAADATIVAIETLAEHIKDGEYNEKELDTDIDNIMKCVDAWMKL